MRWIAVLFALLLVLVHSPAGATTGGPLLAKVLGWDAGNQRAYCQQMGWDEGLERECVYYFDLRSARPERPVVVPWSVGSHSDSDTLFAKRFGALQRRLRPLPPEFARAVPISATVVSDSAVSTPVFEGRRYIVDVVREVTGPVELRVATFHSGSDVRILREYRLPGFAERLAIVSFVGDTVEGGYEVQQVVVLGPRVPKPQILDCRQGVLPCPKL